MKSIVLAAFAGTVLLAAATAPTGILPVFSPFHEPGAGPSLYRTPPVPDHAGSAGSVSGSSPLPVTMNGTPSPIDRFSMILQDLSDEELFGDRHSFGRSAGDELQRAIDRRLGSGETVPCPENTRVLAHMILLREHQLKELAWRDYQRNRFGHRFDRPSAFLGEGFSSQYDEPIRKIREQRSKIEGISPP